MVILKIIYIFALMVQTYKIYYNNKIDTVRDSSISGLIKWFYKYHTSTLTKIICNDEEYNFHQHTSDKGTSKSGELYYFYTDGNNEIIFDSFEDENKILCKLTPNLDLSIQNGWLSKLGKLYSCSFQGHSELATELFASNTIKSLSTDEKTLLSFASNHQQALERRGWVKISNKKIHTTSKMTHSQKRFIYRWASFNRVINVILNNKYENINNI